MEKTIKIHEDDNVAVVIGGELDGHKIALRDIKKDENIIKYGFPIGHAIQDIKEGEHVHVHNIKTNLGGILEYKYNPNLKQQEVCKKREFQGYVRKDGSVGIRNEIWIVNTVGCINRTAERLAKLANEKFEGKTDGIYTFVHPYGCSQMGDDQSMTQKVLAGLVKHPNAAGVLVLGLGCENNNIGVFKEVLGEVDADRVKFMSTQEVEDEIETGLELIGELVEYAGQFKRTPCSTSKLVVGLKCGGSDGFSGITANPLLGAFSDLLVTCGGSTILTEVPEMFGAETLLMNRCENEEVFNKTVELINDFKEYFMRHNQVVYENPSPGNKKGGITTLEDKSLGCVQKGGSANIVDVIKVGEQVVKPGLNLLNGPGNDIVAVTNLTASGCHLILFTTGRGTPLGAPVPTIKVSSNSDIANRKPHWIDFNAGPMLEGKDLVPELMDFVIEVASGGKTNNEKNNYREISIFKDGVTL